MIKILGACVCMCVRVCVCVCVYECVCVCLCMSKVAKARTYHATAVHDWSSGLSGSCCH